MSSTFGSRRPALALVSLALIACGRGQSGIQDSAWAGVQERGRSVMGVNQYTSRHVFEDLSDGGRIVLERDDAADTADIATIRAHMRRIQAAFTGGDFTLPGIVHNREVPGTDVMANKKDAIAYAVVDRPRGAELRVRSRDSTAIAAIHEFLAFQRSDHRAAGHDAHAP